MGQVRILLLNPPSSSVYRRIGLVFPPLGLAYLAAALEERGHEGDIIDLEVERVRPEDIPWSGYAVVGISSDTPRYKSAIGLAKMAKNAGCTVVLGGYHPTFADEETLSTGVVDYVVRGEGELTLVRLIERISRGEEPSDVPGLSYLKNSSVVRTGPPEAPQDLDSQPFPARHLLRMDRYRAKMLDGRPVTTVVTSRGCPYGCSFCSSSAFSGRRWRARSPESVVKEVDEVSKVYGFHAIAFMDDNFSLNPLRVVDICRGLIKRSLDLRWWCFSRADTVAKNEDMVKWMARAGASMVFLGLESGSDEVLEGYGKKASVSVGARAVEVLRRHGIRIWASFIIGALEDTLETIRNTVSYARRLAPDIAEFSILTPFPGTRLYEKAASLGLIRQKDWSKYDGAHAVMDTYHMKASQVARAAAGAYISFYCRLSRAGHLWQGLKMVLANAPSLLGFRPSVLA